MEGQQGKSPGGASSAGGNGGLGSEIRQIKDNFGSFAQERIGEARDRVKSGIEAQKDMAADQIGGVAEALRSAAGQFKGQQAGIAGLAETAASQLDHLSGAIRERDLDQLVDELEGFARSQPVLFFAGAMAIGFFATRFLRASGAQAVAARASHYQAPSAATTLGQGGGL